MSAVGVPLMLLFGYLCSNNSPVIEIPPSNQPDPGKGWYMAAFLYALTSVFAYSSMSKSAKAREVDPS